MPTHTIAECRSCGHAALCDDWTLHTRDIVLHNEGYSDQDAESDTGLCESCLEDSGPDDDCGEPPAEQDEAEARAEMEYRTWDRGEL